MAVSLKKPPDPRLKRRRASDKPLTLARMRRWYETAQSFAGLLPYRDYDSRHQAVLLEDGQSVGALLELTPHPTEARPDAYLALFHMKLQTALTHALAEEDPPWILQLYLQSEPVRRDLMATLRAYGEPAARGTAFTDAYLALFDEHLKRAQAAEGYLLDSEVMGQPWRASVHRVRAVLYRRLPRHYRSPQGILPEQELHIAVERLSESLRAAGVGCERRGLAAFHGWLTRWLNPRPAIPGHDIEALADRLGFVENPAERPFGADLAESLLLGMPASSEADGAWYLDGLPHVALTLQRLLKAPGIGHLSAERRMGAHFASTWDKFPPGAVLALTLIAKPQDQVLEGLEVIERRAVGDGAEAARAREEVAHARGEVANGNKLYPMNVAIYLKAANLAELRHQEEQLTALLLAEGLQPISREHDLLRLDSVVRNLPLNFDPAFDREARWARLTYADHIARLLPAYGRSRGTGNPGIVAWNRGGEPFTFDPLNRRDRKKNAHTLIVGPPGSGKSSFLLSVLAHQIAVRRPRIFLTEVGRSFELFAEYLKAQGVSVNRVMLMPEYDVRLPPFADALHITPDAARALERLDQEDHDVNDAGEAEDDAGADTRDVLAEMELAARLMVTGGEAREVERMKRSDLRLIQRALIEAGGEAKRAGKGTVLTADVARALRRLPDLEGGRRERAEDMADCLELYCAGFVGKVFNRAGVSWPDVDVTILNLGLFANEGMEDKLALAVIGLVNHVNAFAERTRYEDRQVMLVFDEAHIVTSHALLAPYLTKATKVWGRRYAVWLWLATQNMEDFPPSARRMLNAIEWWIALFMPPEEVEQLAKFRDLTAEQKALLLAVRKAPGQYTEGVLLHDDRVALFRNVPPPLMLALAQTEQHERAARMRIAQELGISELEAVFEIARRIEASRGGNT